ncbi:MAG: amidohydrolase [Planctomycetes bacterium]|nr:amidohydrolase [Planctomycetota bacterium]
MKPARGPIDVHVHIQPWEMMKPWAHETITKGRGDYELIKSCMASTDALVDYLDQEGIERVALVNYVAPEIMGFTPDVNDWASRYRDRAPDRIIAFGGIHPPATPDVASEMRRLFEDLRLDALKIHAPHQDLAPNAYRQGLVALETIYGMLSDYGKPLTLHTGTSVFPGARSALGDPMLVDDVAVDFPDLKIILAHGGRPLWMEAAFFLLRRHPNVYLDISGIPPQKLLEYFPRLEEVGHKVMFGTDWPSPGVKSIRKNLDAFEVLPLSEVTLDSVRHATARRVFGLEEE